MEPRSLKYIAEACEGELTQGSPETMAARVCTDSRQLQSGDLFVALVGDRFDGHQFLAEAACLGACAVVAERDKIPPALTNIAVIAVANARQALGKLAARYRRDFTLPIIAVAGSNGKTTTKEILAAVLSQEFLTLWSQASYNNDVGVPTTLLKLESAHRAAVLEAGTNHPGELAPLVKMIQPRLGIITSLGREHLEFFRDMAGVADEEGWLAELLPADGTLFVNGDNCQGAMEGITARSNAKVVRLGQWVGNDWRVSQIRMTDEGTTFRVDGPHSEYSGDYRIKLLGKHQAVNALFAVAVGAELGLASEKIRHGLAICEPAKMRLQMWQVNGLRVLDDTYNANVDSMLAALETLRELACQGRRVAVLGDMAELGEHSAAAHIEVGQRAAEIGIDSLFAVGKWANVLGRAARMAGLDEVAEYQTVDAAAGVLKEYLKAGDTVLLKASRTARMERIGEALRS